MGKKINQHVGAQGLPHIVSLSTLQVDWRLQAVDAWQLAISEGLPSGATNIRTVIIAVDINRVQLMTDGLKVQVKLS